MSYIYWNCHDTLWSYVIREKTKIPIWWNKGKYTFWLKKKNFINNAIMKFKLLLVLTSHLLNLTQGWKLTSSNNLGFIKESVKSGIPLNFIQQSIYNWNNILWIFIFKYKSALIIFGKNIHILEFPQIQLHQFCQ